MRETKGKRDHAAMAAGERLVDAPLRRAVLVACERFAVGIGERGGIGKSNPCNPLEIHFQQPSMESMT